MATKSNRPIDGVTFDVMVSALMLHSGKSRATTSLFLHNLSLKDRKILRHSEKVLPLIVDVLTNKSNWVQYSTRMVEFAQHCTMRGAYCSKRSIPTNKEKRLTMNDITKAIKTLSAKIQRSQWLNIGGQLIPETAIASLKRDIKANKIIIQMY